MELARNKPYISRAKLLLQNFFLRISCAAIDAVLKSNGFGFTPSFNYLKDVETQRDGIDGDGSGQFARIPPTIKVFIKHNRPKKLVKLCADLDHKLVKEVSRIPQLNTIANKPTIIRPDTDIEIIDLISDDDSSTEGSGSVIHEGKRDSSIVQDKEEPKVKDCLCCYMEYPQGEMKECSTGSGHFVCTDCIYRFVSEQLDGNGSIQFKCIVDADCQNHYSSALLDSALSPKLNRRVNDLVIREEMKKAGINSWTCPTCAYIGFIERNFPWILCPECDTQYCTTCNDVYHHGRTCEDVRREKERLKDPQHMAHEAMSKACKRFCPHCDQEYIKGDGCNKITCSKPDCKKLSCYLCGDKIDGYSHFCNHKLPPGKTTCTCGKPCRLFTSTGDMEQLDRKKRQEAGLKVLADAGVDDEEKIRSILASPPKENLQKKKAAIPAQPVVERPQPVAPIVAQPPQRQPEAPRFRFGADANRPVPNHALPNEVQPAAGGFRFGAVPDGDIRPVPNQPAANAPVPNQVQPAAGGFRFGVEQQRPAAEVAPAGGFRFGGVEQQRQPVGFRFGGGADEQRERALVGPHQQPAVEAAPVVRRFGGGADEQRERALVGPPVDRAARRLELARQIRADRAQLEHIHLEARRNAERLEQIRADRARRNAIREERAQPARAQPNQRPDNNVLADDQPQRPAVNDALVPPPAGGVNPNQQERRVDEFGRRLRDDLVAPAEPANALQPEPIRHVANQPVAQGNAPLVPPQQNDAVALGAAALGGGGDEVEDARVLLDACRIT